MKVAPDRSTLFSTDTVSQRSLPRTTDQLSRSGLHKINASSAVIYQVSRYRDLDGQLKPFLSIP